MTAIHGAGTRPGAASRTYPPISLSASGQPQGGAGSQDQHHPEPRRLAKRPPGLLGARHARQ